MDQPPPEPSVPPPPPRKRRRPPRRFRPLVHTSLPAEMLSDLKAKAAAATSAKDRTVSGQLVRAWEASRGLLRDRRARIEPHLSVIVGEANALLASLRLPEHRRRLERIKVAVVNARLVMAPPAAPPTNGPETPESPRDK